MSRHTEPTTHPTVLLPGQAASPPGPCDLSGMYLMHHAFRRDLRDLLAAAERTPLEDRTAWGEIGLRWERFAHHLHEHHAVEDRVLWPLLLERVSAAADAEGRAVLSAMEAEHALIDPLLDRCADLVGRLVAGPDEAALAELPGVLAETRQVLDDHLGHEERDAVVLVQRHVGGGEWADLERREFRGRPSLGELRFQLPWMVHEVPDEVVTGLVRAAGPGFALILRVSRGRFLRHQRAAFKYVA
ncbi:hemerythrin domain-containing protein [Nocardioides nitrophenolicus]|uniref:hemerythrin domain-containing protein n=1 Tax=Nocardioides nitrophenolicus TaxID=60489 RepID=UPI00195DB5DA|nr:hemerythrin domain-containing protein [Nocardioides nitrophenolicus]MBM7517039.1 hemerythrin-like domain-containing protein [Nocardioides nitrophenolicus]